MGVLRFRIEPPSLIPSGPAPSAYITGADGRVHVTRCEVQDGVLNLYRQSSESSTAHIAVCIPDRGQLVLSTTSLPEREHPYHLGVELLRGVLGEVREQAFGWEMAKMSIPDRFRTIQRQAFQFLAAAGGSQEEPATSNSIALSGLKQALNAADILIESYVLQRASGSRTHIAPAPSLLGCTLDATALQARNDFVGTFSSARVPIEWRWIEPVEGEYQWELTRSSYRSLHRSPDGNYRRAAA